MNSFFSELKEALGFFGMMGSGLWYHRNGLFMVLIGVAWICFTAYLGWNPLLGVGSGFIPVVLGIFMMAIKNTKNMEV